MDLSRLWPIIPSTTDTTMDLSWLWPIIPSTTDTTMDPSWLWLISPSTTGTTMDLLQDLDFRKTQSLYYNIVTNVIPGPLSLSYFVPLALLPVALMIPPSALSKQALAWIFVPVIWAVSVHAWIVMGGVDVCSVDAALWATYLLAFSDPRINFRRLRRRKSGDVVQRTSNSNGGAAHIPLNDTHKKTPSPPTRTAIDLNDGRGEVLTDSQNGVHSERHQKRSIAMSSSAVDEEAYPQGLFRRLGWILEIMSSPRLFSWKIGSSSHDAFQMETLSSPPTSRIKYSIAIVPVLLANFLIIHPLTTQLVGWSPDIPSVPPHRSHPPRVVSAILNVVPRSILTPMLMASYAYTALNSYFQPLLSVVCFSNYVIGIPPDAWSPHTSPTYFGSFSNVTERGLTGLWGGWWHQTMRFMTGGVAAGIADALHLKRGSSRKYILIVMIAFFLSGVTHMGMIPPFIPRSSQMRLKVVLFFLSQGVGIVIENAVLSAFKKTSTSKSNAKESKGTLIRLLRRIGLFTWVITWLCLTNPLLQESFDYLGWYKIWPPLPPFSHPHLQTDDTLGKVKWFLAGEWIP